MLWDVSETNDFLLLITLVSLNSPFLTSTCLFFRGKGKFLTKRPTAETPFHKRYINISVKKNTHLASGALLATGLHGAPVVPVPLNEQELLVLYKPD